MSLFNLNNQQVARLTSKTVYKNLYQDIIHKDGFGITDRFVTPEQTKASLIDIYVPVPIGGRFRMRGASVNGYWANQDNAPDSNKQRNHVLSKRFTIDILKRYDFNIAVSEDEIEMPDITPLLADAEAEETLEPFGDVDYEEELEEDGESAPASMTPWREDSK